jgi:thymidine kinase
MPRLDQCIPTLSACGKIIAIVGAMFTAKTSAFVNLVQMLKFSKRHRLMLFSPFEANRVITDSNGKTIDTTVDAENRPTHNAMVASRNGGVYSAIGFPRDNPIFILDYIRALAEKNSSQLPTVVAIEECQFVSNRDIITVTETLANPPFNMTVIVGGLDTDFRCQGFNLMPELMARADEVQKLNGVCKECGDLNGSKTWLDSQHWQAVKEGNFLVGDEHYRCLCRKCRYEYEQKYGKPPDPPQSNR